MCELSEMVLDNKGRERMKIKQTFFKTFLLLMVMLMTFPFTVEARDPVFKQFKRLVEHNNKTNPNAQITTVPHGRQAITKVIDRFELGAPEVDENLYPTNKFDWVIIDSQASAARWDGNEATFNVCFSLPKGVSGHKVLLLCQIRDGDDELRKLEPAELRRVVCKDGSHKMTFSLGQQPKDARLEIMETVLVAKPKE